MHCVERDVIEDGESEDVVESQGGMRVPNGHGCSLPRLAVAYLRPVSNRLPWCAILVQAGLEPKWLRTILMEQWYES